jgi:IS5 family transposase
MVDTTISAAAPLTKNKDKARDPEMHQTKKGNEWHFGMKAHIVANAESGLVHSVHATAANEGDVVHTHEVLHGSEDSVFLDAGYTGVERRAEIVQAQETGAIRSGIEWYVAEKRSKVKKLEAGHLKDLKVSLEHLKAKIRARVEHPFHVI